MKAWLKRLGFAAAMVMCAAVAATAETTGSTGLSRGGTLLVESLSLLLVLACLLATFKLYASLRGGKIGRGWLWFILGFSVLGVAQLLLFGGRLGFMPSPGGSAWVDVLRLLALILLFVGVTRFRKLFA
ncbi:MAG TPA: hypothetical protein VM118_14665 [Acidobacteriota bacterium]|nr:hypothetical protein [Acidobacteriota bacterium]